MRDMPNAPPWPPIREGRMSERGLRLAERDVIDAAKRYANAYSVWDWFTKKCLIDAVRRLEDAEDRKPTVTEEGG